MKKKVLLAALAATGIVAYLVSRKRAAKNVKEPANEPGRSHLTDAFSKAKAYATGTMG